MEAEAEPAKAEEEPAKAEEEPAKAEFGSTDAASAEAATKIQAITRGKATRKTVAKIEEILQAIAKKYEEEKKLKEKADAEKAKAKAQAEKDAKAAKAKGKK